VHTLVVELVEVFSVGWQCRYEVLDLPLLSTWIGVMKSGAIVGFVYSVIVVLGWVEISVCWSYSSGWFTCMCSAC
jgi:hypothetical protein